MGVTIVSTILVVVIGLIFKLWLDRSQNRNSYGAADALRITAAEFLVVGLVSAIIVAPVINNIGDKLSTDNILRYEELVNGVETLPVDHVTKCRAGTSGPSAGYGDSNCEKVYASGSYSYTDTCYRSVTEHYTDADGKPQSRTVQESYSCTKSETIYSPYATQEHSYWIEASAKFKKLDTFYFPGVYLDADPQPYGRKAIPRKLLRGPPADWVDAYQHWVAGTPRAVTAMNTYDNYILASGNETLKTYGGRIEQYRKAGLFRDHTAGILKDPLKGPTQSHADKVSFIGVNVPNAAEWQRSLMQYNGACGPKLTCDLHVVLVDCLKVTAENASSYTQATKAYWQGPVFGKRAIAKNAVILILGVCDNSRIAWAEATTGMPFGNKLMAQELKDSLPGTPLNPRSIFGSPQAVINGSTVTVTHPEPLGIVENIMFNKVPFKRARMECNDGTCIGYKDLVDQIDPTKKQKSAMILVVILIACVLWFVVASTDGVDRRIALVMSRGSKTSTIQDRTRQDDFPQYSNFSRKSRF
jgi:hypothetical protein